MGALSPSPSQFRAARAMLGWSMHDLASAARVSVSEVLNAEGRRSETVPDGTSGAIRAAFETAGVSFLDDDGRGRGVRLAFRRATSTDGLHGHARVTRGC